MYKLICNLLFIVLLFSACNPMPEIDDQTMLDGNILFDLSINSPQNYLVSEYIPNPTEAQKDTPVIIAAHGYSASTFEWDELRDFANQDGSFYVSQVLLGGHGRSYADFKAATWENWQQSIKEEYIKLSNMGFGKIYLAGSSTGCPLIVQLFKSNFFANYTQPKAVFLIDPIVVSSNKTLTLVGLLGPVLGYTTTDLTSGEEGKWYVYRPQESLKQLMDLIDLTRRDLEKTITLTPGTQLKIYKSKIDETADPVSAVLLYKGLRTAQGNMVDIEMINSDLHVYTRLRGREGVTQKDEENQRATFQDMKTKMTN